MKMSALHRKAIRALAEAVAGVVEQHKRSGRPLVIWKNGKVVFMLAKKLKWPRGRKKRLRLPFII